jgi:hypothetical protein
LESTLKFAVLEQELLILLLEHPWVLHFLHQRAAASKDEGVTNWPSVPVESTQGVEADEIVGVRDVVFLKLLNIS